MMIAVGIAAERTTKIAVRGSDPAMSASATKQTERARDDVGSLGLHRGLPTVCLSSVAHWSRVGRSLHYLVVTSARKRRMATCASSFNALGGAAAWNGSRSPCRMEAPGRVRGMRRRHEPVTPTSFCLAAEPIYGHPGRGDFLVSNFHPGAIPGNLVRNDFGR